MAAMHIVSFASLLILALVLESYADSHHSHHSHHSKHIIHAPLHIKLIHHHKIIKVPVVFRKHIHHHKHHSHENIYIPLKKKPIGYEESAGSEEYPAVVVHKESAEDHGGDEGGISGKNYYSHIAGGHGSSERSDQDNNSYEYDESKENHDTGAYHYVIHH